MSESDRKAQRLRIVLVVCGSVAFFACTGGEGRQAGAPSDGPGGARPIAESPRPATASFAQAPAPPEAAAPGTAVEAVPASGDDPTVPSFGTAPAPEESANGPDESRTVASPAPAGPPGSRIVTNADLARYRQPKAESAGNVVIVDTTRRGAGGSDEPAVIPSIPPEEIERETAEIQRKIDSLMIETDALKRRIPSLHNPLLPRVAPTEADTLSEAGMDNVERLARVNQKVSENEEELNRLRARLAELHVAARAAAAAKEAALAPSAP